MTIVKTVLAQFNFDSVPRPEGGWARVLPSAVLFAFVGLLAAYLLGITRDSALEQPPASLRRRQVLFGLGWAAAGWAILLLPSIGWHAYYGSLGSLGFWFALATVLSSHRRAAIVVLAFLLFVREARLETPSWDWGAYWYQRRAGSFLNGIRTQMFGF